ncbi:MAG: type II toxin-antitoxin system VapC family toxin [Rhodanobacteraceae bacterium]
MTTDIDGKRLYLDSNIFIFALEADAGALRRAAADLLRAARARRCTVVTGLLSRAEVLVRPLRTQQVGLADRYRRLLSGSDMTELCAMEVRSVDLAAELRADYPTLRLPDALHVAVAVQAGCDALVTADRRLAVVAARIRVLPLDQLAQ